MLAIQSSLAAGADSRDMILTRFAGDRMRRFVEGLDRGQSTRFPECLEDWIGEDNPVRVINVFVDELDLAERGFSVVDPQMTGRPSYHPSALLKLYIYGYLNQVQSSRRLERDAGRNVEVIWLTGRLVPGHKTIADFRKDNGVRSCRTKRQPRGSRGLAAPAKLARSAAAAVGTYAART